MQQVDGHAAFDQGAACMSTGACLASPCAPRTEPGGRLRGDMAQMLGGHARCQCGVESRHLFSNRERREWHRAHKEFVVPIVGGLL